MAVKAGRPANAQTQREVWTQLENAWDGKSGADTLKNYIEPRQTKLDLEAIERVVVDRYSGDGNPNKVMFGMLDELGAARGK
jgi:hypothetical protein